MFSDAIRIEGPSAAAPITNVTIDRCLTDEWGFYGIYAEFLKDYTFIRNRIEDSYYAHIMQS